MGFPIANRTEKFDADPAQRELALAPRQGAGAGTRTASVFASGTGLSSSAPPPSKTPSLLQTVGRWIAVAGGCGNVPIAPGTAGSAAGALLFLLFFGLASGAPWLSSTLAGRPEEPAVAAMAPLDVSVLFAVFVVGLGAIGIWASGVAERSFGRKDDGRIVIDEVVGQWVALAPLLIILRPESSFFTVAVGVVTGFVLFRLFDVWKPGAIRWAERHFDGGFGVMADDLVAGVYAAGALAALAMATEWVIPGFLGGGS